MPLRPNMELEEGTTITTGPGSTVDLQVNGRTSTVRVVENSRLSLKKMQDVGAGDSQTMLNIDNGTVFGSVKKITKESTYDIQTPRGVAGIRGTDWAVQVSQLANGNYTVTFTSATGKVFVVANISIAGVMTQVPKTLTDGQSWTPPDTAPNGDATGDVTAALPDIIAGALAVEAIGGTITVVTGGGLVTIVPHITSGSTIGGNAPTPQPGGGGDSETVAVAK
jgi:hypothetical protein